LGLDRGLHRAHGFSAYHWSTYSVALLCAAFPQSIGLHISFLALYLRPPPYNPGEPSWYPILLCRFVTTFELQVLAWTAVPIALALSHPSRTKDILSLVVCVAARTLSIQQLTIALSLQTGALFWRDISFPLDIRPIRTIAQAAAARSY